MDNKEYIYLDEESVTNVLKKIQECVRQKKLRIVFNRVKNEMFSEKYNMDISKISKIILKLKTKNFARLIKVKMEIISATYYIYLE